MNLRTSFRAGGASLTLGLCQKNKSGVTDFSLYTSEITLLLK
jgi:hypothetical protein